MKLAEENKIAERSDGRGLGREKKRNCVERRRDKKGAKEDKIAQKKTTARKKEKKSRGQRSEEDKSA